ncbi:hypothetical protein BG006_011263 [Podila minutissima]|uniref:Major facilitator superfamily (MFS) profile domain-containing protein n=1 Tax=Podila minutissima TaxID=64525 RepID=A0A9P5VI81_9FUNG|nr:hypothetical protein BG006_011263 [Podila minutissima]
MAASISSESTQLDVIKTKKSSTSLNSNKAGHKIEVTEGIEGSSQQKFEVDTINTSLDIENQGAKEQPAIGPKAAILLFIGLAMATFLASLDGTIIATALPKIASDFKAQSQMSWVATSYLLTFNAFQPLYGKFSDIFGRKAMILFATVTFMIGSAGAGAASTMTMLIAFRAIQGLGGSGLMGVVLIIISDIFPLDQRAKYQSIIWSVFGVSSVVGPLLGGVFVEQITWRWCFYINLPLGIVTLAAVILFLRLPFETQELKKQLARIDYLGTLFIIISVVCLLLPITWGGTTYPWNSATIIVLFCAAAVLIAITIFIEHKAFEAIIPPRLFLNKTVAVLFMVNFMTGMGFLGVIFYSPIYFQVVKGASATASGLHLLPMVMGLVISSIASGAIMGRVRDYRIFIWLGTTIMSIGVGLCMLLDRDSNMGEQIGYLLIVGSGIGLILQTVMLAAQAAVEKHDMAIVTALCGFMNSIGGGIGIAMCSALFNNHLLAQFSKLPVSVLAVIAEFRLDESITAVQSLPEPAKSLVIEAYVNTFQYIFKCILPIACAAFVISLFIRKLRMLDPSEVIQHAA